MNFHSLVFPPLYPTPPQQICQANVAQFYLSVVPDLGSDLAVSSITPTSAKVSYTKVAGTIDSYKIVITPKNNNEKFTTIAKDAANPSTSLSDLLPGTKYTVTINAVIGGVDGNTKTAEFTTKGIYFL